MNLLAFSGGVDSTALFFYLLEKKIPFDIAIVNYHTRKNSDLEVEYAKELAKKYNKNIYIKDCFLNKFSEKSARDCRYKFFEEIILKYKYSTLILAHQLNDRLEWFLMQLSKGAGLKELISMPKEEKRENYTILRPFIDKSKDEILNYLQKNNIKYFIDESNFDKKFKRNFIRDEFSNKFISLYKEGVKRSFEYLEEDKKLLFQEDWINIKELYIIKKTSPKIDIKKIDLIVKKLKKILTKAQRDEIIKQNFSSVIKSSIAIDSNESYIFISPYIKVKLTKEDKEFFRKNKIPPKNRGYISLNEDIKNYLIHLDINSSIK